jgi:hypothetical protein
MLPKTNHIKPKKGRGIVEMAEQIEGLTFRKFVDAILADAQFASNLENAIGNPDRVQEVLEAKFDQADPAQIEQISQALQRFASWDPRIADLYNNFTGDIPGICG